MDHCNRIESFLSLLLSSTVTTFSHRHFVGFSSRGTDLLSLALQLVDDVTALHCY